jgi:hypothetical protein
MSEEWKIEDEEQRINNELEEYARAIRKLREKQKKEELYQEPKAKSLSSLITMSLQHNKVQLSKNEELDDKVRNLADLIIRAYR